MRAAAASSLCMVAAAWTVFAQQPASPSQEVSLSISVTDRSGEQPVTGLRPADFQVFEDGKEQPITRVTEGPGPISVAVVVDATDSMAGLPRQLAQRALEQVVSALQADDQIAVVTCDRTVKVAVPWTAPGEFPKLDWSHWKTTPVSELLQGVYQALGLVNEARHRRTAVIVLSDARQTASKYGLKDFVQNRRESETPVYGVRTTDLLSGHGSIGGPRPGVKGSSTTIWDSRGALVSFDDLVRDSGGRMLPGRTTTEIDRSVTTLVSEIRNQYIVTFRSAVPFDSKFRRVRVEVRKGPHKVRHSIGYLAKAN